jgi:hypothetical protein
MSLRSSWVVVVDKRRRRGARAVDITIATRHAASSCRNSRMLNVALQVPGHQRIVDRVRRPSNRTSRCVSAARCRMLSPSNIGERCDAITTVTVGDLIREPVPVAAAGELRVTSFGQ